MLKFVLSLALFGTGRLGLGDSVPDAQYADLLYRAAAASPYLDSASVAAAASAGRYGERVAEIAALEDQYALDSQLAAEAQLYGAGDAGSYGAKIVPIVPSDAPVIATQYHAQDEFGQYSYGYSNPTSTKTEVKTLDGVVQGTYSYVSPDGRIITNNYVADPLGFRSSLAPSNGEEEILLAAANAASFPAGAIGPVVDSVAQAVGGVYNAQPALQAHPAVPEAHYDVAGYQQAAYAPNYYQPDQYVDPSRAQYVHPSPVEQVLSHVNSMYAPAYAKPINYQYVEPAPAPVLTEEVYVEPSYLEEPARVAPVAHVEHHVVPVEHVEHVHVAPVEHHVLHKAAPVHSVVDHHQVHSALPVAVPHHHDHPVHETVVHQVHKPAQLVQPIPQSVVRKVSPVVHHAPAVVHEPAHVVHQAAPVVHQAAPVVRKLAPIVHKPAPVVHRKAHVFHNSAAPVVHKRPQVVHKVSAPQVYHHQTTTVHKLPSRNYSYKSYHSKPSSYFQPAYKGYSKGYNSGRSYGRSYGQSRSYFGRSGYGSGRSGYGSGRSYSHGGYSRGW